MPHLIGKAGGTNPGEVRLYAPISLLQDPDWKDPGHPGDPNWHIELEGIHSLVAAGVPARYIKAVDVGGGVFEAQEFTQAEKDAVNLPLLKTEKLAELNRRLKEVARLRREQGAMESAIASAIQAASTPAAVQAISVDGTKPEQYGMMVGDAIYMVLSSAGGTIASAAGWSKVPGTTNILGNSVGNSFSDGGAPNRIVCNFDGRIQLWCGMSVEIGGADGLVHAAFNRNNGSPPVSDPAAAFQLAGFQGSGVLGQTICGTMAGPLNVSEGDVIEVWVNHAGALSTAQVQLMQVSTVRIPG